MNLFLYGQGCFSPPPHHFQVLSSCGLVPPFWATSITQERDLGQVRTATWLWSHLCLAGLPMAGVLNAIKRRLLRAMASAPYRGETQEGGRRAICVILTAKENGAP